jgi:hypothetical protein
MRIQISDHQDKAKALREAILAGGHEIVFGGPADLLLIDWDGPIAHYPRVIERAYENGADVYLYSHGGFPLTCWDGIVEPHEYTAGYLAQTPGEAGVLSRHHYPRPVHVIGWHYCDQQHFEPCARPRKILFAPWHPQGTGYLNPLCKQANAEVLMMLKRLHGVEVTVRHVGTLPDNGLPEFEGIRYEYSSKTIAGALEAIAQADLIIANPGTFATLAIAQGKPVVMYGQDITPHDGWSPDTLQYVKHFDLYREWMRYPYDISDFGEGGAWFVIMQAAAQEAKEWRAKFIGEAFDPGAFVRLLETLKQ